MKRERTVFKRTIIFSIIVIIILTCFTLISLELLNLMHSKDIIINHKPILIDGNKDINEENGIIKGLGTKESPYLIDGWVITAESREGIFINNTDEFITISNCTIFGGDNWNTNDYYISYPGIYLSNVKNCLLKDNTLFDNSPSIFISYSNNNIIIKNKINDYAVKFDYSVNNTLAYNSIQVTSRAMDINIINSNNNIIKNNSVMGANGKYASIKFGGSSYNEIINNSFSNIVGAIRTEDSITGSKSIFNRIYNNNFIDNNKGDYEKQAYDYSGFNFWNNSNRGNYWNDWISPDNDNNGIVDVPYQLSGDAAAKDFFPLTKPIIIDI